MSLDIFAPYERLAGSVDESDSADVIASPITIAGFSAEMGKRLNTLVTILWEHNDNIDRDDKYGVSGEMRPLCKLIKFYSDDYNPTKKTKVCKACDEYHYGLLKAAVSNTPFILDRPDFFPKDYINPEIKIDKATGIAYIEYQCSVMGYSELLFSICIEGVFLGAVFVGQNLRKQANAQAERIFDNFIAQHMNLLSENIRDEKQKHIENEIKSRKKLLQKMRKAEFDEDVNDDANSLILCLTNRCWQLGSEPLNESSYQKLVCDSAECVRKLTKKISKIIRENREDAIREKFKLLSKEADQALFKYEKTLGIEMIASYEQTLCKSFSEQLKEFGIKSIRILGTRKNPLLTTGKRMKLTLSSVPNERYIDGMLNFTSSNDYDNYIIHKSNIREEIDGRIVIHPWMPICSISEGSQVFSDSFYSLFESTPNPPKNSKGQYLYPLPHKLTVTSETHIVMLYRTWLVLIEADKIESRLNVYSLFLQEFSNLMIKYLSRFENRLSEFVTAKYLLTLRLYRHECAQIANAIRERNDNDYQNLISEITEIKTSTDERTLNKAILKFIKTVKNKNFQAACDDIDENVKLIIHMADTIDLITARIDESNLDKHEERSVFSVVKDIVFKWRESNNKKLSQRERHTKVHVSNHISKQIYHRKRLLDMVIYNLMDNSLKYSHWGTNIYITIGNEGAIEDVGAFSFKIENYGTYIEPAPKAYDLYYRGNNQGEENPLVDGDGLGLYIVKVISDMLVLYVSYTCNNKDCPISQYNIGLMNEYINNGKDRVLAESLRAEFISRKNQYERIINSELLNPVSDNPLPTKILEADIHKPTYHVSFELSIQVKSSI